MKIGDLFETTIGRLAPFSSTPQLDAQVLIAHILHRPRTWVMAHPENSLTTGQHNDLNDSLARLEGGESFPYILGKWEFFGMEFEITRDVLIPRPETELLVEKAISWLRASSERRTVADIGTGCGAIPVALAMHVPAMHVLATDISLPALKVAQRNARKFHVHHRIDFLQCDLLPHHIDPLPTEAHFDLICANLPYIPTDTLLGLPIYGREPTLALDGGSDGLHFYRRLFKLAPAWLAPNGMMLLEIESTRGLQALGLAYDTFSNERVKLHQDLTGRDRLLEIELA